MRLRKFSLIIGGLIILVSVVSAAVFILNNRTQPQTNKPDDVGVAISDDLTIVNQLLSFVDEGNGFYLIKYQYTINHAGNYPALNLSASSWFNDTTLNTFQVVSLTTNSSLTLNPNFDGKSDRSLLSGNNSLPPMSSAQILLTVRLSYGDISRKFINFVETAGDAGNASSSSVPASSGSGSGAGGGGSTSSFISSSSTSTGTSSPSIGTGTTTTSSRSTVTAAPGIPPASSVGSGSTGSSVPGDSVGSGGSDSSLYDADEVSFPLSALPSTTSSIAAPVGKGM